MVNKKLRLLFLLAPIMIGRCIFFPDPSQSKDLAKIRPAATTARILFENLALAYNDKDIYLYITSLDTTLYEYLVGKDLTPQQTGWELWDATKDIQTTRNMFEQADHLQFDYSGDPNTLNSKESGYDSVDHYHYWKYEITISLLITDPEKFDGSLAASEPIDITIIKSDLDSLWKIKQWAVNYH